jgi:hypothetical protein
MLLKPVKGNGRGNIRHGDMHQRLHLWPGTGPSTGDVPGTSRAPGPRPPAERAHRRGRRPSLLTRGYLHWNNPLRDPSDDLVKLDAVLNQVEDHFLRVLVQSLHVVGPEAIAASH